MTTASMTVVSSTRFMVGDMMANGVRLSLYESVMSILVYIGREQR